LTHFVPELFRLNLKDKEPAARPPALPGVFYRACFIGASVTGACFIGASFTGAVLRQRA
jgi:hypothetical protein